MIFMGLPPAPPRPEPAACTSAAVIRLLPRPVLTGQMESCRDWGRYYDSVKRRAAWQAAHPGYQFGLQGPDWCWHQNGQPPDDPRMRYWDLGMLLDMLDVMEKAGRCPLHGPFFQPQVAA